MIYTDLPILYGRFIRRYKRFFSEIELDETGEIIIAHCPNTGSMKQCLIPGAKVIITFHDPNLKKNKNRKLLYTWEFIDINNSWVCLNTIKPNKIVKDAIIQNKVKEIPFNIDTEDIRAEVKYGKEGKSKIDLLIKSKTNEKKLTYIEIKNVSLTEESNNSFAIFPDSVTTRGQKHLNELMDAVKLDSKNRAIILFAVQRNETTKFKAAEEIDPKYAKLLKLAIENGVEALAYKFNYNNKTNEINITQRIPVVT